ncbi:DOMON domain-containing protein [Aeoliella mucimassa]|uniref:Carbohydrate-binding domain-containing protein n=1 Tax=Aeoliella mucimassa TaxID=2527972 RepID=A0A518AV45_9BACT|nr:hypothetical protein [Aeoliella mucimassa]QDU58594.1 hypothetical protein Pan181_48330 [Aeoliella mucimassa]
MDPATQLNSLLSPRFLFRFAVPIHRKQPLWTGGPLVLGDEYKLPNLAELDSGTSSNERSFADVRMAWDTTGVAITVDVTGKRQPVWCRETRLEDSDGLVVWIDTRATHNIHRASKYCHSYVFLPSGGGRQSNEPLGDQMLINRARENARPIRPRELQVQSKVRDDGYHLAAFVPAVALGGFDPANHGAIGFTYAVIDRELGLATFANGPAFPFGEDPSCWATLEMVD